VAVKVTVVPASTVLADSTSPVKVEALVTVAAAVPFEKP
jgi:hypothetical protein